MPLAAAEKQTVCTITVSSADEKETFRRHLPASKYQFVELVERDRTDWLDSACRADIACDVLVVSGHYDGSSAFFSERLAPSEVLPVAELERISCSDACPSLFSRLKEVYLFGCNTLNPTPQSSTSVEIVNSLAREGRSRQEAERQLKSLRAGQPDNSRESMRQVFKDVPLIYGFTAMAPLGPTAAATLERYFRANGSREIARGRPSSSLLGYFAPFGMSTAQGITDQDQHLDARQDMCQFADDRASDATRLDFVHQLLQRGMVQTLLHLDRIQRLTSTLDDTARQTPAVARALGEIARDHAARDRFMAFAHQADLSDVRVRMVHLAHAFGWLTADQRRAEFARMLTELQARDEVGLTAVDLACSLNPGHELDSALDPRLPPGAAADDPAHAAVRACLGSADGRERTLAALTSPIDADVLIAQAYLRHRPITDATELRRTAALVARMSASDAQVRALETLARHYVADRGIVDLLVQLYTLTPSEAVQAAIAGILIRADLRPIDRSRLALVLRENRRPPLADANMIDALIRQLESP